MESEWKGVIVVEGSRIYNRVHILPLSGSLLTGDVCETGLLKANCGAIWCAG